MKALFIGGTGTNQRQRWQRWPWIRMGGYLLNRVPNLCRRGWSPWFADIHDEGSSGPYNGGRTYDVVAQFIAYGAEDVQRDIRLFQEKTRQYIFISSASAYQKPAAGCPITESTPLINPYWNIHVKRLMRRRCLRQHTARMDSR